MRPSIWVKYSAVDFSWYKSRESNIILYGSRNREEKWAHQSGELEIESRDMKKWDAGRVGHRKHRVSFGDIYISCQGLGGKYKLSSLYHNILNFFSLEFIDSEIDIQILIIFSNLKCFGFEYLHFIHRRLATSLESDNEWTFEIDCPDIRCIACSSQVSQNVQCTHVVELRFLLIRWRWNKKQR